jgi:hypothetical protein
MHAPRPAAWRASLLTGCGSGAAMGKLSIHPSKWMAEHPWITAGTAMTLVFLLANIGLLIGREVGIWDSGNSFLP